MRASTRLAIAAACVAAGMVTTWAALQTSQVTTPIRRSVGDPWRTPETPRSILWLLSVGVSRYADPELNLLFAEKDARSIADVLARQSDGPLYQETRTLLLTDDDVTRESVLSGMQSFLGMAGPHDVAAIFIAGHGVKDRTTGSYYFLPYNASPDNLLTTGLRVSDFDDMVRVIRRNVRGIVLMLDTCHAGAFGSGPGGNIVPEELAVRVTMGEGFFLLAATKPGEESKEWPELGHGAFTYALLEGLEGGVDVGPDGLLTVSDLFGYVARRVPILTNGEQHPYHKMEGTDLVFAAVVSGPTGRASPLAAVQAPPAPAATVLPLENSIGVAEFANLLGDPQYDWIGKALRIAFNTELSKVRALRVYSPELIDRAAEERHADDLQTALNLGIAKLVTGAFQVVGSTLRIDAKIIDVTSGVQQGSDSVEGELVAFFDLQKKLVISILRRLPVPFSTEEGVSIQRETNTDMDAYRLLLESEGIVAEPGGGNEPRGTTRAAQPTEEPHSFNWWPSWLELGVGTALGQTPDSGTAVREVIEEYRRALEAKQIDRIASLYVTFSTRQRDALAAYLRNAGLLSVEVSDISVSGHDNDLLVSFTRRDQFTDRETGRTVKLEVRLTKTMVRENGQWKFAR